MQLNLSYFNMKYEMVTLLVIGVGAKYWPQNESHNWISHVLIRRHGLRTKHDLP